MGIKQGTLFSDFGACAATVGTAKVSEGQYPNTYLT